MIAERALRAPDDARDGFLRKPEGCEHFHLPTLLGRGDEGGGGLDGIVSLLLHDAPQVPHPY